VVANLVGENPNAGLLDADVKAAIISMGAETPLTGNLIAQVKPALINLSAAQVIPGDLATSLQKAIFAGAGGQLIPGNLIGRLNKALFSGNGQHFNNATLTTATVKLIAALNGSQIQSGALSASAKKAIIQMGEGQVGPLASGTAKLVITMTGTQLQTGTIATATPKMLASLSGQQILQGQLALALKKLSFAGNALHAQQGTAAATLAKAVIAMSGAQGSLDVAVDAYGAGGQTTNSNSTTISHVVGSGSNQVLLIWGWTNNPNWTALSSYPTKTAVSSLSGSATMLVAQDNTGSQQQGGVVLWVITNPAQGTHSIPVTIARSSGTQTITIGYSISLNNVSSLDTPVVARVGGFTAPAISIPSDPGDWTIAAFGRDEYSFNGVTNNRTTRYTAGASTSGEGAEWALVSDAAGASPSVAHTLSAPPDQWSNCAIVGINANKAA